MRDVHEAVAFARQHFYDALVDLPPLRPKLEVEKYRLHRALQYDLCTAYDRMMRTLGEITRRDIVMFCECWLAATRVVYPHVKPIETVDTPETVMSVYDHIVGQASDALIAEKIVRVVERER